MEGGVYLCSILNFVIGWRDFTTKVTKVFFTGSTKLYNNFIDGEKNTKLCNLPPKAVIHRELCEKPFVPFVIKRGVNFINVLYF